MSKRHNHGGYSGNSSWDDRDEFDSPRQDSQRWRDEDYVNTKTSNFDSSKMANGKGNIMGIDTPDQSIAELARFGLQQVLPDISIKLGEQGGKLVKQWAEKSGKSSAEAMNLAKKSNKGIAYGLVFIDPLTALAKTAYKATSELNELRTAVAPIFKAQGKNPELSLLTNTHNEVINNARQKIMSMGAQEAIGAAAGSVAVIPGLAKVKGTLHEYDKKLELEELANATPEKYAEIMQKQVGEGWKARAAMQEQTAAILKEQKKLYDQKFDAWKKDNKTKVTKEFIEERNLLANNDPHSSYDYARHTPRSSADVRPTNPPVIVEKDIRENHYLKTKLEQTMREKFAQSYQPWDESFIPENLRGRDGAPRTMKSNILGFLDEKNKEIGDQRAAGFAGKDHKKDAHTDNMMDRGWQLLGSVAGSLLSRAVTSAGFKQYKESIALDKILHMRRMVEENSGRDSIPSKNENSRDPYSFSKYVDRIFNQHQHDSGKSAISEDHDAPHFRDVGWRDEAIFKMNDKDLTAYEVAVKHISKRIKDGRMDALALVNLVGDRKIVNASGKSFGTQGKNGTPEDVKKSIMDEINAQTALLKPHHKLDDDARSEQTADLTFTPEETKALFAASGLKGAEKAFMFAVLDATLADEKSLKEYTGLGEQEIQNLRKESQGRFDKMFNAAVREIADLVDTSPELFEKLKVSREELANVQKVAEAHCETGESACDVVTDKKELEKLNSTVANVMMAKRDDKEFWQNLEKERKITKQAARIDEPEAHEKQHRGKKAHKRHESEVANEHFEPRVFRSEGENTNDKWENMLTSQEEPRKHGFDDEAPATLPFTERLGREKPQHHSGHHFGRSA